MTDTPSDIGATMTDTMTDSSQATTDTVSVTEAAALLGISERTFWRRVKQGKIDTEKTADGVRVRLSDVSHTSVAADATVAQALEIIQEMHEAQSAELERLRRDNQQLAGQVGFLQAKLQDAERQIALLQAPRDDAPGTVEPTPASGPRRPWWRLWR